jgi:uroporphyrinogen-III synthase
MSRSDRSPIAGHSVVVTRSRAQSSELVDRLAGLGATVVELPVIAIEDPPDGGAALAMAAHRLVSGAYQWVACTSANAVGRLLDALDGRPVPSSVHWAAVGAGTAQALVRGGFPAELVPPVAVSESLADLFPSVDPLAGGPPGDARVGVGTVLFPRAESVRSVLAAGLRAKGWLVEEVVSYRTVAGDPEPEALAAATRSDAIAFTSSSTVVRTLDLLGPGAIPPVVVTIGPITSATARQAGIEVSREAEPHSIDGLIDALAEAFGHQPRP